MMAWSMVLLAGATLTFYSQVCLSLPSGSESGSVAGNWRIIPITTPAAVHQLKSNHAAERQDLRVKFSPGRTTKNRDDPLFVDGVMYLTRPRMPLRAVSSPAQLWMYKPHSSRTSTAAGEKTVAWPSSETLFRTRSTCMFRGRAKSGLRAVKTRFRLHRGRRLSATGAPLF